VNDSVSRRGSEYCKRITGCQKGSQHSVPILARPGLFKPKTTVANRDGAKQQALWYGGAEKNWG